jgi:hypothetical protein
VVSLLLEESESLAWLAWSGPYCGLMAGWHLHLISFIFGQGCVEMNFYLAVDNSEMQYFSSVYSH